LSANRLHCIATGSCIDTVYLAVAIYCTANSVGAIAGIYLCSRFSPQHAAQWGVPPTLKVRLLLLLQILAGMHADM